MDIKRKALHAVKGYGRQGIGEALKEAYAKKPAIAISIETVKAMPKHGGMSEADEGEGDLSPDMLAKHEAGESIDERKKEGEYGQGMHEMPNGSMMKDSEMGGGEGDLSAEKLLQHEGGEMPSELAKEGEKKLEITPELLQMLLARK
jgi:hypothetical protein